jgi:hypothetical protein
MDTGTPAVRKVSRTATMSKGMWTVCVVAGDRMFRFWATSMSYCVPPENSLTRG